MATTDSAPVVEALTALLDVVKTLSEGEECEHSVGVCWCDEWHAIELGENALRALKEREKTNGN